jgi:hypothetical protein
MDKSFFEIAVLAPMFFDDMATPENAGEAYGDLHIEAVSQEHALQLAQIHLKNPEVMATVEWDTDDMWYYLDEGEDEDGEPIERSFYIDYEKARLDNNG